MNYLLDDPETEKKYKKLLADIRLRKNGEISDQMKQRGVIYKVNWGVSLVQLRELAGQFEPDHLLALKLWNKQWRETMILSALLDEPGKVTEEQMDFRTRNFENTEIAEVYSAHLWPKCNFSYIKALEWCRGKKHIVRYTGVHLMGRLAMSDKKAIDEMFEPFIEELQVLARDKKLYTVIYRTLTAMARRSSSLSRQVRQFASELCEGTSEDAGKLGKTILEEISFTEENGTKEQQNN